MRPKPGNAGTTYQLAEGFLVDERLTTMRVTCDYEACGSACCRGGGLGTPLSGEEIERIEPIAGKLGQPEFWEISSGARMKCRDDGDCLFFVPDDSADGTARRGGRCCIQEIKPLFCSLFPIVLDTAGPIPRLDFSPYPGCRFKAAPTTLYDEVSNSPTGDLLRRFKRV